ncbi:MAG: hypothetical protein ACP5U1_16850 [Desulfomonilaceae bacterium]
MLLRSTARETLNQPGERVWLHWRLSKISLMALILFVAFSGARLFAAENSANSQNVDKSIKSEDLSQSAIGNRFEQIEKTLQSIKITGEKAEDRSYFNKLASTEVIKYLQIMIILLVFIALGFPLAIWLLNRTSFGKGSGSSQELTETLLVIEERQAKLANILKEIQGEIDYLHTMSAPDLKNLIQQAENYLKMNENDLKKAGAKQEDAKS